jgi:hypothetical protein
MPAIDPERAAAIQTRFLGRLSWMLLGAVVILGWGPLREAAIARAVALTFATMVFVGLNVPTVRVVARARREAVAFAHWAPIGAALVIRAAAYLIAVVLVW